MILFLERDIARKTPIGFDDVRRNIFDPSDNSEIPFIERSSSRSVTKKRRKDPLIVEDQDLTSIGMEPCHEESPIPHELGPSEIPCATTDGDEKSSSYTGRIARKQSKPLAISLDNRKQVDDKISLSEDKKPSSEKCIRFCCSESRRFDSLFCSDGCGVASMESDLLRSLLTHASYRNRRCII